MVQVPKLRRFNATGNQQGAGRINQQVQNSAQSIVGRTNAINSVVGNVADIYQEYENDKIKTISSEAEIELKTWNDSELQKLKTIEGDPTKAYADYEDRLKTKSKSYLEKNDGISDRVKRHVASNINKVAGAERVSMLKQRGAQVETYKHNLYESKLALKRKDLPFNVGNIDFDDRVAGFTPYDDKLNDIKTDIAVRAVDKNTATVLKPDAKKYDHSYVNENKELVKVNFDPQSKLRMTKEISRGVEDSLDALIVSGQLENAKKFKAKYDPWISPDKKLKLNDKMNKEALTQESFKSYNKIQYLPDEQQLAEIEKITDTRLRQRVQSIRRDDKSFKKQERTRKEEKFTDNLTRHVIKNIDKYKGVSDLENDPVYKKTEDTIPANNLKQIRKMVENKQGKNASKTDPKTEIDLGNIFLESDQASIPLDQLTPEKLELKLVNLPLTRQNYWRNKFQTAKGESTSSRNRAYNDGEKFLQQRMIVEGQIKPPEYGQFSTGDLETFQEARSELWSWIDASPDKLKTPKEIDDFVKSYVGRKIKSNWKPINPNFPSRSGNANVLQGMDQNKVLRYKMDYRKQFNVTPTSNDSKFLNFVEQREKNGN